jgi:hypothetical protein
VKKLVSSTESFNRAHTKKLHGEKHGLQKTVAKMFSDEYFSKRRTGRDFK